MSHKGFSIINDAFSKIWYVHHMFSRKTNHESRLFTNVLTNNEMAFMKNMTDLICQKIHKNSKSSFRESMWWAVNNIVESATFCHSSVLIYLCGEVYTKQKGSKNFFSEQLKSQTLSIFTIFWTIWKKEFFVLLFFVLLLKKIVKKS